MISILHNEVERLRPAQEELAAQVAEFVAAGGRIEEGPASGYIPKPITYSNQMPPAPKPFVRRRVEPVSLTEPTNTKLEERIEARKQRVAKVMELAPHHTQGEVSKMTKIGRRALLNMSLEFNFKFKTSPRGRHGNPDHMKALAERDAKLAEHPAQPQGDTVPVSARWTDWSMVTLEVDGRHRTYVECGKAEQPQGEPVYQVEYVGSYAGWRDVDEGTFSDLKKDPRYKARIMYAEQPAPVEVAPKSECPNCLGDAMFGCDACTPDPVAVVLPEREAMRDIIAQAIGGDAYDCTRVWSAWGVGTMSDDDFIPIVDQEERLYEIADACLDAVTRLNTK